MKDHTKNITLFLLIAVLAFAAGCAVGTYSILYFEVTSFVKILEPLNVSLDGVDLMNELMRYKAQIFP